jgi:hypothetical protein
MSLTSLFIFFKKRYMVRLGSLHMSTVAETLARQNPAHTTISTAEEYSRPGHPCLSGLRLHTLTQHRETLVEVGLLLNG